MPEITPEKFQEYVDGWRTGLTQKKKQMEAGARQAFAAARSLANLLAAEPGELSANSCSAWLTSLSKDTPAHAMALLISSTSLPTSCWVRPTFSSSRAMYSSTSRFCLRRRAICSS